jgi:hypothetical protein
MTKITRKDVERFRYLCSSEEPLTEADREFLTLIDKNGVAERSLALCRVKRRLGARVELDEDGKPTPATVERFRTLCASEGALTEHEVDLINTVCDASADSPDLEELGVDRLINDVSGLKRTLQRLLGRELTQADFEDGGLLAEGSPQS